MSGISVGSIYDQPRVQAKMLEQAIAYTAVLTTTRNISAVQVAYSDALVKRYAQSV